MSWTKVRIYGTQHQHSIAEGQAMLALEGARIALGNRWEMVMREGWVNQNQHPKNSHEMGHHPSTLRKIHINCQEMPMKMMIWHLGHFLGTKVGSVEKHLLCCGLEGSRLEVLYKKRWQTPAPGTSRRSCFRKLSPCREPRLWPGWLGWLACCWPTGLKLFFLGTGAYALAGGQTWRAKSLGGLAALDELLAS